MLLILYSEPCDNNASNLIICNISVLLVKTVFRHRKLKTYNTNNTNERSSRPEVFCKKGILRNFAKFTGKHLCQSLFF